MSEVNYNDGKWHGWNGGECPVHPATVVEALWFDGGGAGRSRVAKFIGWESSKLPPVAFRVIKEHREPREIYAYHDTFGNPHVCDPNIYGATLFREVIQ